MNRKYDVYLTIKGNLPELVGEHVSQDDVLDLGDLYEEDGRVTVVEEGEQSGIDIDDFRELVEERRQEDE